MTILTLVAFIVVTHADVCLFVCLSLCPFFPQDISKSDAVRITKLDTEMVHYEF